MSKKILPSVLVMVIFVALVVLGIMKFPPQSKTGKGQASPAGEGGSLLPETLEGLLGTTTDEQSAVQWLDPEKPMQSLPVEASEIPKEAAQIDMTAEGITPSVFEVKKGQTVIMAVSSKDEWTHIFKFKDKTLSEVAVGVGPGQTRAITFYAPKEKGEYEFFCDVPGHEARGEKGKMVVK